MQMGFERLDVYQAAVQLVELVAQLPKPRGQGDVHDQLVRASTSVVLNVAEGLGRTGKDRHRFMRYARGSATECAAALRILLAFGAVDRKTHARGHELCGRLYAMTTRMAGLAA